MGEAISVCISFVPSRTRKSLTVSNLLGPVARRDTVTTLAELTGGKCLTVQDRLAPQHSFPAALLDFLIAYLSLLRPPPGSLYAPVQAQHIVFSGDSSGSEIALATIHIILAARTGIPIT